MARLTAAGPALLLLAAALAAGTATAQQDRRGMTVAAKRPVATNAAGQPVRTEGGAPLRYRRGEWKAAAQPRARKTAPTATQVALSSPTAANWSYNQRGKPYNWNYLNTGTRSAFYCSHLVWASFKDNFGVDLNTSAWLGAVHPMELVDTPKTYLIWRKA